MCTCLFLSALELASVSTALPTIANDLHASQYTWVGTAYALASTAFLPMSGGLAQTFGRRPVILLTIVLFAIGSCICGAANSMDILIIGRTIQGLGGGGIQSLTDIILADLVTLQERGLYSGLYGVTWCLAASIGPVVGGVLATKGQWRWLFYLNLPITLIACISVILLLDLPIPPGNYRDKLVRMDWIGNFLVITSTTVSTIGLTWGGVNYPWSSNTILFLLALGLLGLGLFIGYEFTLAKYPLVPFSILKNVTSLYTDVLLFNHRICGRLSVHPNKSKSIPAQYDHFTDCFPVYYQACKGTSASTSGIYLLTMSTLAPAAIISGLSVKTSGRYRPQTWAAWALTGTALAVMSRIHANEPLGTSFGSLALLGWGIGMLCATSMYPIQAPLPVTQNAPALAFMWFLRAFAAVWGITIGNTVLQNELAKRLPASFVQSIPQGTAIMYALIPQLSELPPQTLAEVRVAFADSLAVLWRVLAGVCGAGLLASLLMKGIPLHDMVDEEWAFKVKKIEQDIENMDPTMTMIDITPITRDEEKELADDAKVDE
ncbi:major facilitator superfamily domain-containing protein [Boletus reticuloceps]|uniref:Major facilitator superfamily domain-containing protein n=1 Tax=Boletus reticuloceps TaxID=495285 RepID=A0A8I2YG12_9AGAM|nr:major facilitator superfamily domain-containing protein [Boletus reticuloceps]